MENIQLYMHVNPDNNQAFYIGIGEAGRAYSTRSRNQHWRNIANKHGFNVIIIHENLSWQNACELEQELIDYIGRRNIKTGILVNLTGGGEGTKGLRWTEESKLNKSKQLKEYFTKHIHHSKGKPRTEAQKLQHSLKMKGHQAWNKGVPMYEEAKKKISKRLIDRTGNIYGSVKEAAQQYNIKRTTLNAMLSGQTPNKTDLKYYNE